MSTDAWQKRPAEERSTSKAVKFGWGIYQQIAAIIGAFAVLAFLTNFVDFDWRGWLATLISVWDDFVRPPVHWLTHYVIEVPLGWVGWDMEVPQWLRDYFAVGFVLAASGFRAFSTDEGWKSTLRMVLFIGDGDDKWNSFVAFYAPLLLWPISIPLYLWATYRSARKKDMLAVRAGLMMLSPLIYAGILLALNYLVLR